MPKRSWTLLGSRDISDHRIFRVRHDLYRHEPSGNEREFVVLDTPSWVNVVPVTPEGNVVLIRQYRHGIQDVTIEIPGGMIDEGESPEAAAVRELHEETGYEPEKLRFLARVLPNPAIQNNWCYLFAAEGCRKVSPANPDAFEVIEVFERPLGDVPTLIENGEISQCMVVAAFGFMGMIRSPKSDRQ